MCVKAAYNASLFSLFCLQSYIEDHLRNRNKLEEEWQVRHIYPVSMAHLSLCVWGEGGRGEGHATGKMRLVSQWDHQSCCLVLAHPLNGGHSQSGSGSTSASTSVCLCVCVLWYYGLRMFCVTRNASIL